MRDSLATSPLAAGTPRLVRPDLRRRTPFAEFSLLRGRSRVADGDPDGRSPCGGGVGARGHRAWPGRVCERLEADRPDRAEYRRRSGHVVAAHAGGGRRRRDRLPRGDRGIFGREFSRLSEAVAFLVAQVGPADANGNGYVCAYSIRATRTSKLPVLPLPGARRQARRELSTAAEDVGPGRRRRGTPFAATGGHPVTGTNAAAPRSESVAMALRRR